MKHIAIVGAGAAGVQAAAVLAARGFQVTLLEQGEAPLHHVQDKALLFPHFRLAAEVVAELAAALDHPHIRVLYGTEVTGLVRKGEEWELTDARGSRIRASAVLLTTGYRYFDARRKEELGYGIYKGVITSVELEKMLIDQRIVNVSGDVPRRVCFLQCVGSRDEKSGNHYCSKVCCVTAVKQAIEVKRLCPNTECFVFYMDLRMWGQGFEELYREAQERYGINFVRGRISEAAGTFDSRVQIKSEDTLLGLPLKLTTDLLVLMVGMEASCGTRHLARACGLEAPYGFVPTLDPHLQDNETGLPGLFAAGSCKRPMSLQDCLQDARAAALAMETYLQ